MDYFYTILTPTILLETLSVYKEQRTQLLYVLLDSFFIVVLLNFRKLIIRIDNEYLIAAFGLIKKRINLSDINYCEPIDATLSLFTGMGMVVMVHWFIYLSSVQLFRIHFDTGSPFVFSTRNQEKVIEILRHYT